MDATPHHFARRGAGRHRDERPEDADDGLLVVLRAAGAAAWRSRRGLAAWFGLCLAASALYAHSVPPSYTAVATLLLEARRQAPQSGGQDGPSPTLDTPQADSQLEVIRSERLLSTVFEGLGLADLPELAPQPPGAVGRVRAWVESAIGVPPPREPTAEERRQLAFANFAGRVGARRVGQSYVVEVSYSSGDPTTARRVANATVSAYLAQSIAFKADAARNGAEFLQSRVNALTAEAKAASLAVTDGTIPSAPTSDADARIIGAALQPLGRSAPRTGLIVAFGAATGILTGLFGVALANALHRRVRTPDDVVRYTGLRCLGEVPSVTRRSGVRRRSDLDMGALVVTQPSSPFAQAIRDLRTSVALGVDAGRVGPSAIAVTSWESGAGATTLASNLARAVRGSGHPVTLVDGDVHRAGRGLTGMVRPVDAALAEALVDGVKPQALGTVDMGGVSVLPARSGNGGPVHDAFLGAPEMRAVLERSLATGEVFVDLPPLSSAGDVRAAALHVDGVVIVARAGRTTRDELVAAVDALASAGATVLGVAINRAG